MAACLTASTSVHIIQKLDFRAKFRHSKSAANAASPARLLLRQALPNCRSIRRRSALIGDSLRDIGAARGFGIWAYGVRTGHGCRDRERYSARPVLPPVPDLMFENVSEAVISNSNMVRLLLPLLPRSKS